MKQANNRQRMLVLNLQQSVFRDLYARAIGQGNRPAKAYMGPAIPKTCTISIQRTTNIGGVITLLRRKRGPVNVRCNSAKSDEIHSRLRIAQRPFQNNIAVAYRIYHDNPICLVLRLRRNGQRMNNKTVPARPRTKPPMAKANSHHVLKFSWFFQSIMWRLQKKS